jgi:hypothetical protein
MLRGISIAYVIVAALSVRHLIQPKNGTGSLFAPMVALKRGIAKTLCEAVMMINALINPGPTQSQPI